jgi:hypothetical protein
MATYPLNYSFKVYPTLEGCLLQLTNNLVGGTPGIPSIKITLPNGGEIRSAFGNVPAFGDGEASALFVFAPLEFTLTSINENSLEEGQFQKPSGTNALMTKEDFSDGIYELSVTITTPSPENTYTSVRHFLIANETKALLLNKMREIQRTYPQIPYSVMYSGAEKRAIRSMMLLKGAEIELERGNVAQAKEMTDTVIRFVKTWLEL